MLDLGTVAAETALSDHILCQERNVSVTGLSGFADIRSADIRSENHLTRLRLHWRKCLGASCSLQLQATTRVQLRKCILHSSGIDTVGVLLASLACCFSAFLCRVQATSQLQLLPMPRLAAAVT